MTVTERAQAAVDGNGEPGMYDDYDQACLWSGLVQELLAEIHAGHVTIAGLHSQIGWHERGPECAP